MFTADNISCKNVQASIGIQNLSVKEGSFQLAAPVEDCADLGDLAGCCRTAGGLQVEHAKRHVDKGGAEVVEGALPGECHATRLDRTSVRCEERVNGLTSGNY